MNLFGTQKSGNNVKAVEGLVEAINSAKPSVRTLYRDAFDFFTNLKSDRATLRQLSEKVEDARAVIASNKKSAKLDSALALAQTHLKEENLRQENLKQARLASAIEVCERLVELTEGNNFEETQIRSARFLGAILLSSSGWGKTLAEHHQRLKPAYKAVLSMRLVDKLINSDTVKNSYILKHHNSDDRFNNSAASYSLYFQTVMLPILLTAIYQDVGMQHPELLELLEGEDNKDPFRMLGPADRKTLLRQNYRFTQIYLKDGLGQRKYQGNSKLERDLFVERENARVQFQAGLLKDSIVSKLGIGEIVKIPQIYASIVLSTKRQYIRKELPKAAMLIEKFAEKEQLNKNTASAFVGIVGYFPQGYGVTYIPLNTRGYESAEFEYAIVNRLNPVNPNEPICRVVTRNLTFISSGSSITIKKVHNLHFREARKKLEKVSPARLKEILEKLVYEFKPEDMDDILPTFWEPCEYFSIKKNQNIWSLSV